MNAETEQVQKPALVFPSRAKEELHYAGKQFTKSLIILVVLALLLYLAHFFSSALTILIFFIGLILWLATVTYSIGHFVRFLMFSKRNQ